MSESEIVRLIEATDEKNFTPSEDAREELVKYGPDVLPYFLEHYPRLRTWRGRTALVYTAMKFSRVSPMARELGRMALADRSGQVRYFACMLLAVSLDRDSLPALRSALDHPDPRTVEDARAAIDAIEHGDHNLFLSRGHTGKVKLEIGGLLT